MFDIIIKNGKKESYIKLNGNKLEGFSAVNGVITSLTEVEINTINLLKLSDNKEYLGKDNEYDVYLDNNSLLKHYLKNGVEDIEATWKHNGKNALLYSEKFKMNDKVKRFLLKGGMCLTLTLGTLSILLSNSFIIQSSAESISNNSLEDEKEPVSSNSLGENLIIINGKSYEEKMLSFNTPITYEQIKTYIDKNDNLTEEEKELFDNKKMLSDIFSYYENTNMNILIPIIFDDLKIKYFLEAPKENGDFKGAFYDPLIPDTIFVNTYKDKDFLISNEISESDIALDYYDRKAHEYVHIFQASYEYKYLIEASAEIISCEYDEKCVNASYENPVKNTKILMEMIGPEPIWKLNFSGDDTDLVTAIKDNLEEEQANDLINLLKEDPSETEIEDLDTRITNLLSQMYRNMYGQEMATNPFIDCLLGNGTMYDRYYFNSDLTIKTPYTSQTSYNFWHAYAVSNFSNLDVLNDINNPLSEELYILIKNDVEVNNISNLTQDFLEKNKVKFYYHGKEISFDSINLERYKNNPITYQGDIILKENKINYYLPIFELFPDQRINIQNMANSF